MGDPTIPKGPREGVAPWVCLGIVAAFRAWPAGTRASSHRLQPLVHDEMNAIQFVQAPATACSHRLQPLRG